MHKAEWAALDASERAAANAARLADAYAALQEEQEWAIEAAAAAASDSLERARVQAQDAATVEAVHSQADLFSAEAAAAAQAAEASAAAATESSALWNATTDDDEGVDRCAKSSPGSRCDNSSLTL